MLFGDRVTDETVYVDDSVRHGVDYDSSGEESPAYHRAALRADYERARGEANAAYRAFNSVYGDKPLSLYERKDAAADVEHAAMSRLALCRPDRYSADAVCDLEESAALLDIMHALYNHDLIHVARRLGLDECRTCVGPGRSAWARMTACRDAARAAHREALFRRRVDDTGPNFIELDRLIKSTDAAFAAAAAAVFSVPE